jgi:dinuclear metal center protein, YbgI/SA1388 family
LATVKEIYNFIDTIAPFSTQMSFDNAGFLVGHEQSSAHCVLCALDVTEAVIEEAVALQAELIVSHHPVIYSPYKQITDQNRMGKFLLRLIECGIAVISAHTNLDISLGGVNDALAQKLELQDISAFDQNGLGRIGIRNKETPVAMAEFVEFVKTQLTVDALRCYDAGRPVERIAVLGGSGGENVEAAAKLGCDTYVTSDVKHSQYLEAISCGINLIDAGHFKTEDVIIPVLVKQLEKAFPAVEFFRSEACAQPYLSY